LRWASSTPCWSDASAGRRLASTAIAAVVPCHSDRMPGSVTVDIRPFGPADAAALLALSTRLMSGVAPWREPEAVREAVIGWVSNSIDRTDPDRRPIFVAESAGTIVGFVTAGTQEHWAGALDAYVGELVIDPRLARRGLGRRLMERAERWAREQGYTRLTVQTGAGNAPALGFYTALGYEPEDVSLSKPL
jgi:GNAT superfamily N-acetyltransferase